MKLLQLINEIKVVPSDRVIVGFPFVHDPIGGEYLKTDEAEILSLDSLRSKFRECEESGLIEVFICDDSTESIVERAVCCLPRLPENSKLPGGFKFLDLDEISTEGMVFAIIEKFPNMTLPTIRTGLNNYFLDYDSGDDVSFQEALQHLFDTGI